MGVGTNQSIHQSMSVHNTLPKGTETSVHLAEGQKQDAAILAVAVLLLRVSAQVIKPSRPSLFPLSRNSNRSSSSISISICASILLRRRLVIYTLMKAHLFVSFPINCKAFSLALYGPMCPRVPEEPLEQLVKHETEENILLINEQLVVAIARGFAICGAARAISEARDRGKHPAHQ